MWRSEFVKMSNDLITMSIFIPDQQSSWARLCPILDELDRILEQDFGTGFLDVSNLESLCRWLLDVGLTLGY